MNIKTMLPSFPLFRLDAIYHTIRKDIVFSISMVLALTSCIISLPKLEYIDFGVLASLFNIMIVIKAFEELQLLEKLSAGILARCGSSHSVSCILILMSFFSSMIFTNDVALLTMVPLTLVIGKKAGLDMTKPVIFQTLAANIGSSLTPMGNPQNLAIYSFYKLNAWQFFSTVSIFSVIGLIWLLMINRTVSDSPIEITLEKCSTGNRKDIMIWTTVLIVIVLSVFRVVDYRIAFLVTLSITAISNKKLLLRVDYRLLLTFVCFFVFIGNISHVEVIRSLMNSALSSKTAVYFGALLASQVISNVPSAVLLSGFTMHWREVLLGVNVGGMGTIIASLASLISYKLYTREYTDRAGAYMAQFTLYNIFGLVLFGGLNYLLLQLVF